MGNGHEALHAKRWRSGVHWRRLGLVKKGIPVKIIILANGKIEDLLRDASKAGASPSKTRRRRSVFVAALP